MNWTEIIVNKFEIAFKINIKDNYILEIDDNKNNISFLKNFKNMLEVNSFIIAYIKNNSVVKSIHARNKEGGTFKNITDLYK